MTITIIAAVARNRVIGKDGDMPWHLPADLKFFKRMTAGHTVVMGRRTFESFGGRPLPKRRNLVITRNPDYAADGVEVFHSLPDAVGACTNDETVFICGGAGIYRDSLDLADRMYLTRIEAEIDGDTCFPEVDWDQWQLVEEVVHPADADNAYDLRFQTYDRARE